MNRKFCRVLGAVSIVAGLIVLAIALRMLLQGVYIEPTLFEDGSFIIKGCLPLALCTL